MSTSNTVPGAKNPINGTSSGEYIGDTDAHDVVNAGDGNDTIFLGGKGDDLVDGEGGSYNQVDLRGRASDYVFKRNSDGTITVTSAATGTDTLKNINGFYFYGEGKWYGANDLAPLVVTPPAINRITGTAASEMLSDTNANDVVKAGDGNDTIFLGGKGDDIVDGEGGNYNQVDLRGSASDYTFKRNSDGTITVSSAATGTDKLKNINGFYFYGDGKWYSAEQLAPSNGGPAAPDAVDDAFNGQKDIVVTGNLGANDKVAPGDTVTFSVFKQPANGTVTINADGTFTYVPKAGFVGTDTFLYDIKNAAGSIDCATVTIEVKQPPAPQKTASLGDRVWLDSNKNGIQDTGEQGVAGVTVQLKDANGNVIATQVTDAAGNYLFDKLAAGNYSVNVVKPGQYDFTTRDAGTDDTKDSDANTSGATGSYMLKDGDAIRTADIGLVQKPVEPVKTASIGDYVWRDLSKDGQQQGYAGEIGFGGITVNLKDANGNIIATTQTNAGGYYLFDKLAAGNYSLQFIRPDGYEFTKQDIGDDKTDSDANASGQTAIISLKEGEAIRTVDAGLVKTVVEPVKTASIGDRVWLDTNKNGIQDSGEQGVANVTVQLKDGSGNVVATQQTDAAGNYLFDKLAAGNHSVNVIKPGQYDFTTRDAGTDDTKDSDVDTSGATGSYTLKDGDAIRTVDIGLVQKPVEPPKTGSIGDRVWLDANKDGLQSTGEVGVAGLWVHLTGPSGTVIASTQTDANGYYLFDNLAAGQYKVFVGKPDQYEFTPSDVGTDDSKDSDFASNGFTGGITLEAGQHIRTIDAGLVMKPVEPPKTGSIGDRVWLDTNKDGMQTGGEQGVAGVTVQLKNASGAIIATQQTDAAGNYLFDKLAAGNYTVNVVKPGQYDFTAQDVGPNDVNSDFNASGSTGTIGLAAGQHIRTIDAGLVTKVVVPVNRPPVAVDDQGKVKCADTNGININVLANDSDPDGNPLVATLQTQAGNGTVMQNADGTMHYKPRDGFSGWDSFTYTVYDGKGGASTATVRVEVEQPVRVNATIVGPDSFSEGGIRFQWKDYYVKLDKPVDQDTYYTIKTNDITAQRTYDYITSTANNEIVLKIPAGQTQSNTVGIYAYNDYVTLGNSPNEPNEQFSLSISNVQGSGNCEVITPTGPKVVTIINENVTPIALDLNRDGEIGVTGETTSHQKDGLAVGKTVQFDIDADGDVDTIEWFNGDGDGILVNMAKIGPKGEINGEALFGDQGGKFANGYAKLAGFDANGDAMISGDELKGLGLWVDNGDAVLQDGELRSAAEFGIASISTDMSIAYDANGRELMQSFAVTADGEKILSEDVWFSQGDHDQQPTYHQIAA